MVMDFPFHIAADGRTAATSGDPYIRDLIEQVLFTAPGERVNRPEFGSGLHQLVFAPNSDETAAAVQLLVQGALQQWLGDLIELNAVEIVSEDARLDIAVRYTVRATGTPERAEFRREL